MIRDPAIVAGLVILGPILLINIGLFCWPRIFLYIAFRRIALERGYSFKGISLLPFKFKMGIDQNEIVFHIYGLRGAQFTAEIAVENESNIDLEIKLTDWNEKSSAYFDKKMKNPKTYVYLFAKKFVVIRSSISREEIVSLFGTYLSRVSARTSFGLCGSLKNSSSADL